MILGVIPARFASTRFPGKPLALVGGVPMVVRVLRRAEESGVFGRVVVATDDERIAAEVDRAGGAVAMTSPDCPNGTLRCREAVQQHEAEGWEAPEAVVNVQGDEPFVHPDALRTLAELIRRPGAAVATLALAVEADEEARGNRNRVKVVRDLHGNALYFSRSPIPAGAGPWLKHIGLYAFTRGALEALAHLHPTPLEQREGLEQLRWLEHGWRIAVGITPHEAHGIDTPEDLDHLHRELGHLL
jgi:3-deoxy-manno-octulosonate cytidylyltransferase (CMP-KDO synthetase)